MANISWRRDVKNILYHYYENLHYLQTLENNLIYAQPPHREGGRSSGIADPTAVKGMLMDKGEIGRLKQQLAAVNKLLNQLESARRDAKYKRLLLEMVYFRRSHSLYGAAAYLGIPERTAHRWNAKILHALAEELGYFTEEEQPYLPRSSRI